MKELNMKPFIEVTSIEIEGHSIPVPPGLSELLHQGNAWGIVDKAPKNQEYHREVVKIDGELTTVLTKKQLKKEA